MSEEINLNTTALNTWCPGCGNFAILNAIKAVLKSLVEDGVLKEDIVIVSGIGCHGKIVDYINVNSFNSLHGRAVATSEGIKLGNPKLKVICFSGDGDAYGEGLEHIAFAAKRNVDITVIVHNNRVYGLTTGQFSPTSPTGYKGRSTPYGTIEHPFNPLELMLTCGATYLARGTSHGIAQLKELFKEAILHNGFSLIDVLQVCFVYYNLYEYYDKRVYSLENHNPADYAQAYNKIREWDYNTDNKIALGNFYKKDSPSFGDDFLHEPKKIDIDANIKTLLEKFI